MTKPIGYFVVYDNGEAVKNPYGWDTDCAGAVAWGESVVLFPDRQAARKAIEISVAKARLDQAQGRPANGDFLPPYRKCVKIVPVVKGW